jgi:hypothetical protein
LNYSIEDLDSKKILVNFKFKELDNFDSLSQHLFGKSRARPIDNNRFEKRTVPFQ